MFECQRKIISIPTDFADHLSFINERVKEYFTKNSFVVQYFDNIFDEWVNIETNYTCSDLEKLFCWILLIKINGMLPYASEGSG